LGFHPGAHAVPGRYWSLGRLPAERDREPFTRGSGAIAGRQGRQPNGTAAPGRKSVSVSRWKFFGQ